MKRVLAATLLGALSGVSATAAVLIAASPLLYYTTVVTVPSPADLLWITLKGWGPGDLVLAFALAVYLRSKARPETPRGRVLTLGAVAGLLLGLLNLVAILAWTEPDLNPWDLFAQLNVFHLIFLGASLAGGAALGLACAWAVSRPSKEPS